MKSKYDIHPDFQIFIPPSPSLGPINLKIFNFLLVTINRFAWKKHKNICQKTTIQVENGQIELSIIRPQNIKPNAPCLVYYHGGAFALLGSPQHIETVVTYAKELNICVVYVDYRLMPKHVFPTGFDDSYTALKWVVENAKNLDININRTAVGGDSAGGTMAASVMQKATHEDNVKLCGQMLIYPVVDKNCDTPSAVEYIDVPAFNAISNRKMWDIYLKNVDRNNPPQYAAPSDGELSQLAPAYIETAEFDPLRDEGIGYAKKLQSNGVEVELNETKRTIHGYDLIVAKSDISQAAIGRRLQFLKSIFGL